MRVLFIGGTGNISTSCTVDALAADFEVFHLNRGNLPSPEGVNTIVGDIRQPDSIEPLIKDLRFDVVVDWIAFTTDHLQASLDLFRDKTDQFIFISSASVYHKPVRHPVITESTPAHNPFWKYSQNKILCEQLLWDEYADHGLPMTIVRPSHTYSDGWFPTTFGSPDFTYCQRMLDGKPIVVHGDGESLWTITHTDDFARGFTGLLGHPQAIGEIFHITSDEQLSWNEIHVAIGNALGVEPEIVHVPSEVIAAVDPDAGAGLIGDKQYSVIFDNSKIKRYVPGFQARIPFHEGMRRSVAWSKQNPDRVFVDQKQEALVERLLEVMATIRL